MKKRTVNKLGLVALIVAAILAVMVVRESSATGRDNDDQRQEQDQGQEQSQDQDQGQEQSQDQTNDQSQANSQAIEFNGPSEVKTTGRAYQSSGDATADCQKFGGISSAWLGGALGLGINFTDKECRQLQVYDRLVDRGLIQVANATLCGTRTLRKLYGRDGAGQCQDELSAAYQASQDVQESEFDALRRQVQELSELSRTANTASQGAKTGETANTGHNGPPQVAQDGRSTSKEYPGTSETCGACPDCSEEATRAFQACVSK